MAYGVNNVKYALAQEATVGTQILTGGYMWLATEMEIPIIPGINKSNVPKQRGLSYQKTSTGQDFKTLNIDPTFTLPFMGNAETLALPLAMLCQNVTISAGTPNIYQFNPYTTDLSHDVSKGDTAGYDSYACTLIKQNEASQVYGETMTGSIVKSLTIGSAQDGQLTASAEMIGMAHNTAINVSTGVFTDFATSPLIHSDFGVNVHMDTVAMDLLSWSMTITNNATPFHGTSQTATKFMLGKFGVTLQLVFPWDTTNWISDIKTNDHLFEIWRGSKTGATTGDFYVKCNFDPNGDMQPSENGGMKVWTLNGIGAHDGSYPAFQCILGSTTTLITSMD